MKLLFEEKDNLNDKDLIILLNTDLEKLELLKISDIMKYYEDNNISEYDILVRIAELMFNSESSYKLSIGEYSVFKNTYKSIEILMRKLNKNRHTLIKDIPNLNNTLIDNLNSLLLLQFTYNFKGDSYNSSHKKILDLIEYDKINGNNLKMLFSNYMISARYMRNLNNEQIEILWYIQYVFNIKYDNSSTDIFESGKLSIYRRVPEILYSVFNELSIKYGKNEIKVNSYEYNLFKILIDNYVIFIGRNNLDNLRYIKCCFSDSSNEIMNIINDINDNISPYVKALCELPDYVMDDFDKYKNKLLKFSLEKAM